MTKPEFGWYGAGFACFKGDELTNTLMPPWMMTPLFSSGSTYTNKMKGTRLSNVK